MRVSFLPYIRKRSASSEYGTLYIRITCERKHLYINLNETVFLSAWNAKAKRAARTHPGADDINDLILLRTGEMHRRLLTLKLSGVAIDFTVVYREFAPAGGKENKQDNSIEYLVKNYCDVNNLSHSRVKQFHTTVTQWNKHKMPANMFAASESDIIKLRNKIAEHSKHNTVISHLKRIKSIYNMACRKGELKKNPMAFIKIGEWQSDVKFLTVDELNLIQDALPELKPKQQAILKLFLFSCFTGMRFSDVIKIKSTDIVSQDGNIFLNFQQKKTRQQSVLPLNEQAVKILPDIVGVSCSNYHANRVIKDVGKMTGIAKEVSFHLSRHTFATIGLNKGITLDAMQGFLGHSDIKTTQIYAHLLTPAKVAEMAKFHAK